MAVIVKPPKYGCDPCCTDWKSQIKELWAKYQNVTTSIKVDNTVKYPDGNGQIAIEGILTGMDLVDFTTYYTLTVANDIPTANLLELADNYRLTIGV